MRERSGLETQQPDYSKYAEIKGLPQGCLQLLDGMDGSKFAITAIIVVTITAIQKVNDAIIIATMVLAAIVGIVLVLGVVSVTRRESNGETFTNPTKNPPKPGNARGHQGKPRTA